MKEQTTWLLEGKPINKRRRINMKRPMNWLLAGVLLASLLAGCATPTPQVIEKEVVVEKEVPVTVVVEKEVVVEKPVEVPSTGQEWELVNPAGVIAIEPIEIASRITSLEDKTVVLYWNGKPSGDLYLDRVAELLTEQVKGVKVIKIYDEMPETAYCCTARPAEEYAQIAALKPDIVIASTAD